MPSLAGRRRRRRGRGCRGSTTRSARRSCRRRQRTARTRNRTSGGSSCGGRMERRRQRWRWGMAVRRLLSRPRNHAFVVPSRKDGGSSGAGRYISVVVSLRGASFPSPCLRSRRLGCTVGRRSGRRGIWGLAGVVAGTTSCSCSGRAASIGGHGVLHGCCSLSLLESLLLLHFGRNSPLKGLKGRHIHTPKCEEGEAMTDLRRFDMRSKQPRNSKQQSGNNR